MADLGVDVRVDASVHDRETLRLPHHHRESVGVDVGAQLRLVTATGPALFTVREADGPEPVVSPAGRDRTGATGERFTARLDPQVVHPSLDRDAASEAGEFVEGAREGDDALVALAPHGGHIEYGTDAQARRLADRGATAWWCAGWWPDGGAFDRWHVTSNETDPASFPALERVARRRYDRAVSFHGWVEDGVGVGGGAPRAVRESIRDAVAAVVDEPVVLVEEGDYRGDDPGNVVNRLADAGVQLEQSLDVRRVHGAAVADAVADALR